MTAEELQHRTQELLTFRFDIFLEHFESIASAMLLMYYYLLLLLVAVCTSKILQCDITECLYILLVFERRLLSV